MASGPAGDTPMSESAKQILPSPCEISTFLDKRERRLRATALSSEPLLRAGYLLAAGELRMTRFDHVSSGCSQCLAAERAEHCFHEEQTGPFTGSMAHMYAWPLTAVSL